MSAISSNTNQNKAYPMEATEVKSTDLERFVIIRKVHAKLVNDGQMGDILKKADENGFATVERTVGSAKIRGLVFSPVDYSIEDTAISHFKKEKFDFITITGRAEGCSCWRQLANNLQPPRLLDLDISISTLITSRTRLQQQIGDIFSKWKNSTTVLCRTAGLVAEIFTL